MSRDFYRDRFVPLSSGPALSAPRTLMESFLENAPPEVSANSRVIPGNTGTFDEDSATARRQEILRVTYPVPCPVAITLQPWRDTSTLQTPTFFPGSATDFPAPGEFTTGVDQEGRYIIEWGVGKARSNLFADFAPGSIQLPIAQYVTISAVVFNLEATEEQMGGAIVSPGAILSSPSATFTSSFFQTADGTQQVERVPFSSLASFYLANDSADDDDYGTSQLAVNGLRVVPASAGGAGGEETIRVARWMVPAAIQPNPGATPTGYPAPIPGNVDRFELVFSNVVAPSGTTYAVGTVVQHIRVA